MICAYALYQTEPDLDKAPDSVAIAFDLLCPVLDKAKEKAENGKNGGSKPKANRKLGNIQSKKEGEKEIEKEVEVEREVEKEVEKEIEIDNISPLIVPNPKTTQGEVTCTAPAPHEPPPCPPQGLGCYTRSVGNDGKEAYGVRQLVRLRQSEYDRLILEFGEMNVMVAIAQMGKWLMETPEEEHPKEHYPVLRKKLRKEPLLRDNGP
nr:MAG TPA: hypothetical protein [Caudoviricetes sp.]